MNRREFPRAAKVAMVKRATHAGAVYCELKGCGPLKKWEYHHAKQDALEVDKSRHLTEADGLLVCEPCHDAESKSQAPILAKALRREATALGVRRRPKQPLKSGATLRGPEKTHEGRAPVLGPSNLARRFK